MNQTIYLASGLRDMAKRHSSIDDVRAAGLFLGVEIVDADRAPDPDLAAAIVNGLRENNVLISASGPAANVLKIRPPLVFTRANADFFIEKLERVLARR